MASRVCFPFVGSDVGGSHVSAAGLIRHLDPSRFEPIVLLQHGRGRIAELFDDAGIAYRAAPITAELVHGQPVRPVSALKLMTAAPRLARFLRNWKVDILHCNDGRTLATWALAARIAGVKLLWHHRGSPRAMGLRLLAPAIADKVVTVSKFAAPRPGWYSAAPRTSVIHSPFDTAIEMDRRSAHEALLGLLPRVRPDTRIVGFFGALIDRKRPLLFVDAIAAMRRATPSEDVRGVIFGQSFDGMEMRVAERAAALGVGDAVHVLGHRSPGPFWLAGCDLLMVPAVDEPFGRTLVEAMLVGTPVVATASGGNIEAIDHDRTGLLVPAENAEALGAACLALIANPTRWSRLAVAARADAQSRFGEARHAEAIMSVYADMLAGAIAADSHGGQVSPARSHVNDSHFQ
ncbi:glycosyltransferase family 4 protein [Flavisphingomonas formosensis]|uniref:glycosyltransferase family 4 protein n=1 Tax=Flavisphingomonas formosensis TaxID=861534 RepID=UPI0012FB44E3|nr:glycosyltransferase family 4 protein [Sphingomonas formosensis]